MGYIIVPSIHPYSIIYYIVLDDGWFHGIYIHPYSLVSLLYSMVIHSIYNSNRE